MDKIDRYQMKGHFPEYMLVLRKEKEVGKKW